MGLFDKKTETTTVAQAPEPQEWEGTNEVPMITGSVQPFILPHWELVTKTYAPPRASVTSDDPKIMEKMTFGVTTLLFQDLNTQQFQMVEMLGSDEGRIDGLIEQVKLFGPQYIDRDGDTYVLARMPGTKDGV